MNKEVNFEIAKLLKEKGFEGTKSPLWYYKDGTLHETPTVGYEGLKCWNNWDATQGVRWDAPTIAEVVMWLYEKHDIWINVMPDLSSGHKLLDRIFSVSIFRFNMNLNVQAEIIREGKNILYLNKIKNAYEVAIKHVLENLIQGGNNE